MEHGSIYNLDLVPLIGTDEGAEKAKTLVAKIKRPVEDAGGSLWHVTMLDFEARIDAVRAFEREMDDVDPGWSGVVSVR